MYKTTPKVERDVRDALFLGLFFTEHILHIPDYPDPPPTSCNLHSFISNPSPAVFFMQSVM